MEDDVATAKALWDKLEATFTAQNNARRLLLRQELNSLKKAPTESIAEFVARAKELATNLEAVGHKPEDSEVSLSLLAGLPKEYIVLVTILGKKLLRISAFPGASPKQPWYRRPGWPLRSIYIVSRQSLYLLDPPSAHIPSSEKPGIELPTDCLSLNHRLGGPVGVIPSWEHSSRRSP